MTKNFQQTPKQQRRLQNKQLEKYKCQVAHSKPRFNPRVMNTTRIKVSGGVPLSTLDDKQHQPYQTAAMPRYGFYRGPRYEKLHHRWR